MSFKLVVPTQHQQWEDFDSDLLFSNLDELNDDLFISDAGTDSEESSSPLEINTKFHFTPRGSLLMKRKREAEYLEEELSTAAPSSLSDYGSETEEDTDSLVSSSKYDQVAAMGSEDHEDYFLQYSLLEMKKVIFTPRPSMKKPKLTPEIYSKQFIDGLNFGDIQELKDTMNKFCASNVKISKKFYPNLKELQHVESSSASSSSTSTSSNKKSSSKKTNAAAASTASSEEQDMIKTIQFNTLNEFFYYMECYYNIIPDFIMTINDHRCCYENNNSYIFITSFNLQGTLLNSSSIMSIPQTKWQQTLPFNYMNKPQSQQQTSVNMEGSLIFYVNEQGLVDNIEFYETQQC